MSLSTASDNNADLAAVPSTAWRLFTPLEWQAVKDTGFFSGTALDHKDKYIHLSLPGEVRHTVNAYFKNSPSLILSKVLLTDFTARGMTRMDWVASRNSFFPHVFDPTDSSLVPQIPIASFVTVVELRALGDGSGFEGWPEGI
jgi:uncharacterized protein (DUF952 family)